MKAYCILYYAAFLLACSTLALAQEIIVEGEATIGLYSAIRRPPPRRSTPGRSPPPKPRKSPPPPRRRSPPPAMPLSETHSPEEYFAQFECPLVEKIDTGFPSGTGNETLQIYKPSANCSIPSVVIAQGNNAVKFQQEGQIDGRGLETKEPLLHGDSTTVRFSVETNSSSGSRHLLSDNAPRVRFQDFTFKEKASSKDIYRGTPIQMQSVTYLLDTCNASGRKKMPFTRPQDFSKFWYDVSGSRVDNQANYYETCSHNRMTLNQTDNIVVGPVPIPCKGEFMRGTLKFTWNYKKCGASETTAWLDIAEEFGRQQALTDPNLARVLASKTGRRVVLVLPEDPKCLWAGLAAVGCGGPRCITYIHGDYAKWTQVYFHELQHNNGLNHATIARNQYGDHSDAMGEPSSSGGLLCNNAPYAYRIGWANYTSVTVPGSDTPMMANFTADSLPPYTIVPIELPAMSQGPDSMVSVNLGVVAEPDGAGGMSYTKVVDAPSWFFSYRVRGSAGGYDSALPNELSQRVFIHQWNGTQSDRDNSYSQMLNFIGPKMTYRIALLERSLYKNSVEVGGALRINMLSAKQKSASITLCRCFGECKEDVLSCATNVDTDCDGLVGAEDPDCVGLV